MKIFVIAALLTLASCGQEERPAPRVIIPHEEPKPNPVPEPVPEPEPEVCWEELRCQNVKVQTRQGCVIENICRIQKVCEALMTTENTRRGK
jgi:hypothetical protein